MGYDRKKKAKIFLLKFADEDMDGLEVRIRSTTMAGLIDMAKLADLSKEVTQEDLVALDPLFDRFIACLDSWNLEDDGEPVPMTKAALMDQDIDFVLEVIGAWVEAAAGVSAPLGQKSNAGELSLAESIPMETLPPSLAS